MNNQALTSRAQRAARLASLLLLIALWAALPLNRAAALRPMAITSIVVGPQTGALTYGTVGSATFAIAVTADTDMPSTTLIVSGLPSGVTGNFSPTAVACTGGVCDTSTLTLSTTAAAFAVTGHTFTVSGDTGSGSGSLTIGRRAITVTAVSSSKPYDGSNTSSGAPSITAGSLVNGDTATWTQTYNNKNVGTGKTLTPAGTVNDGNGGLNYNVTLTPVSTGSITAIGLTVTGITAVSRAYDGTNIATFNTASANLVGKVGTDVVNLDTTSATGTFADKNIGTNKAVTASGFGLSGADAGNYTLAQPTGLTANITVRLITVTAAGGTKVYDGTTSSVGVPTITIGSLAGTDSATWTQTYDNKNVGTGKTLTPAGTVSDGNGGANYSPSFAPVTTGVITAKGLTITGALANGKVYDGTLTVTMGGTPALVGVLAADADVALNTAGAAGTLASKNVGTQSVTASGYALLVTANSGNYSVAQPTGLTAAITARLITVTAATGTKPYDGLNTSTGLPTITVGTLAIGDTAPIWTQTYDNKNVGINKTLTPAGTVVDGNAGLNYTVTFTPVATGSITARLITVTATGGVPGTKVYDGTTSSTGIPTITTGTLAAGDTATWTQTYDNKNFGTGKTLTPAGTITDGNSGLNYTVTLTPVTTGVINKKPLTITAVTCTKTYDATITAPGCTPTNSGLAPGDSAVYSEAYTTKDAGTANKVLTPSVVITDGAAGANYTVTPVNFNTGTINKKPLTITARDAVKPFGTVLTFFGSEYDITSGSLAGSDKLSSVTLTSNGAPADAAPTTYPIVASAPTGNQNFVTNYATTYVNGTLTVTPPGPAFSPSPASRDYGLVKSGVTSPAQTFTITNTGGLDLTLGAVTLTGTGKSQFVLSNDTCSGQTLAANGACTIAAAFKPTSVGAKTASMHFPDNTSTGSHNIALSGKAAAELLVNGGFNTYPNASVKIPTNWTATGLAAADGKNTAFKHEGAASVKIANTSAVAKTLSQTRSISGTAGSTFLLSAWARGQSVPSTAGFVRVQVLLYKGPTVVQNKSITFANGTYVFTHKTLTFTAAAAYDRVVVKVIYSKAGGSAWFDALSLLRAP